MNEIRSDDKLNKQIFLISAFQFLSVFIGLRVPYFYLVWLAVNSIFAVMNDSNVTFAILLGAIPYSMVLKLSASSVSFYTYFMLIATIILIMRTRYLQRNFTLSLLLFAALTVWGIGNHMTDWIKMLCGFVLLAIFCERLDIEDLKSYGFVYAINLIGSSVIGLQKRSNPMIRKFFSDLNTEYINGGTVARFSALYQDPNYFSISVIFAIYIMLILILYKRIKPLYGATVILPLVIFGAMSYSKMFYIAILIPVAMFSFYKLNNSKYIGVSFIAIPVILAILFAVIRNTEYYSGIMGRFQKEDVSNGRIELIQLYLSAIIGSLKTLIMGAGIGARNVGSHGSHNTYIELLYHFGVIGGTGYIVLLRNAFRTGVPFKVRGMDSFAMIVVFMFMIGTLGVLKMNDMAIYYMLIYAVCAFIAENRYLGTELYA